MNDNNLLDRSSTYIKKKASSIQNRIGKYPKVIILVLILVPIFFVILASSFTGDVINTKKSVAIDDGYTKSHIASTPILTSTSKLMTKSMVNTKVDKIIFGIQNIIEEYNSVDTELSLDNPNLMMWISNKNWFINVDEYSRSIYSQYSSMDLENLIAKYMKDQGFTLNTINSSSNFTDDKFLDYIQGYEDNDTICTDIIYARKNRSKSQNIFDVAGGQRIACSSKVDFEIASTLQTPFLIALNDHDARLSDLTIRNNVATAAVNWSRTGAQGRFYKYNGVWNKIEVTQAMQNCSTYKSEKIPPEYWPRCYEEGKEIEQGSAWN